MRPPQEFQPLPHDGLWDGDLDPPWPLRYEAPAPRRGSLEALFVVALILAVLGLVMTPLAIGCSCAPKPPVGTALSRSDAVFVGRVVSWRPAPFERVPGAIYWGYSYDFEVESVYKGTLSSKVTVFTGNGHGDCGWRFRVGEAYLVYAYQQNGLQTNICTRTAPLSRAGADLAQLGNPTTVFVRTGTITWAVAIALSLVAFLAGLLAGRRWRRRGGRDHSVPERLTPADG